VENELSYNKFYDNDENKFREITDSVLQSKKKNIGRIFCDASREMKDEINAGINAYFNNATREVLTDNVVSMLMNNETYQRMAQSMKHFLPEGTE